MFINSHLPMLPKSPGLIPMGAIPAGPATMPSPLPTTGSMPRTFATPRGPLVGGLWNNFSSTAAQKTALIGASPLLTAADGIPSWIQVGGVLALGLLTVGAAFAYGRYRDNKRINAHEAEVANQASLVNNFKRHLQSHTLDIVAQILNKEPLRDIANSVFERIDLNISPSNKTMDTCIAQLNTLSPRNQLIDSIQGGSEKGIPILATHFEGNDYMIRILTDLANDRSWIDSKHITAHIAIAKGIEDGLFKRTMLLKKITVFTGNNEHGKERHIVFCPFDHSTTGHQKQIAAIKALSRVAGETSVPTLLNILNNDPDYRVRIGAAEALIKSPFINKTDVLNALTTALSDTSILTKHPDLGFIEGNFAAAISLNNLPPKGYIWTRNNGNRFRQAIANALQQALDNERINRDHIVQVKQTLIETEGNRQMRTEQFTGNLLGTYESGKMRFF